MYALTTGMAHILTYYTTYTYCMSYTYPQIRTLLFTLHSTYTEFKIDPQTCEYGVSGKKASPEKKTEEVRVVGRKTCLSDARYSCPKSSKAQL